MQKRNKVTDAIGSWFFCIPQFCFKNFLGKSRSMDLCWQSCNSHIVKYIAIRSFRLFWRKVLQNFDRVHFREKKCCRNLDSSLGEKPTDFWQSSNNCGTSLSWRNLNAAHVILSISIITYLVPALFCVPNSYDFCGIIVANLHLRLHSHRAYYAAYSWQFEK